MNKPQYRPGCQHGACRDPKTGEMATATKYFTANQRAWHVCGGCLLKLAIKYGLAPDPKDKPKKKPAKPDGLFA